MSNKLGLIGGWWRVCASGFGLGVDAARAVGIVVFILSIILFFSCKNGEEIFPPEKSFKNAAAQWF